MERSILSLFYQNVRGLRTKTNEFYLSTMQESFDLIFITETWLNGNIKDGEIFSDNYNVYRKDRDPILSGKKEGGGVLIGVRNTLNSVAKGEWSCPGICEDLWVCVTLENGKKMFLCCVYIPPHSTDNNLKAHLDRVSEIMFNNPDDIFIIVGDYNMPGIVWSIDNVLKYYQPQPYNSMSEALIDTFSLLDFKQFNGISNSHNKILDLFYSNAEKVTVNKSCVPFVTEDNFHPALDICINIPSLTFHTKVNFKTPLFKRANYDIINSQIGNLDWGGKFRNCNSNQMVDVFYYEINKIINENVQSKYINRKYPSWFSLTTKRLISDKVKSHTKWKKYGNRMDYVSFSSLRKSVKKQIKIDYIAYVSYSESNIQNDLKGFWSFLASKQKTQKIPANMYYLNESLSNDQDVCNAYADFFASLYVSSTLPSNIPLETNVTENISIKYISKEQISFQLKKINTNKSGGPDNIPAIFIKSCLDTLVEPLYLIFNKSLNEGIFPDKWKLANIVPIYKNGGKNLIENYRGISLLNIFGKVFEAIITDELFFLVKNKLNSFQHGFFRGRSTLTNLVPFVQTVVEAMEDGKQVDAVYTDFSKAFDKVHHGTLLVKLENFGIHGNLLRWIESYLANRSQMVKINNATSKTIAVTSGVPQGSHLGPLLFSIFISNIDQCFKNSEFLLYADDLKFFKIIESPAHQLLLQSDVDRLTDFCLHNQLFLNIKKCSYIIFSRKHTILNFNYQINNTSLQFVQSVKDLGIILDCKMTFDSHIEGILQKALKNLGFLMRTTKDFSKITSCMILYNSLVRSNLEYLSIIWNPYYLKYTIRLEKVQKKFINFLNYKFHRERFYHTYHENLQFYKIDSLENRRKSSYMIFLHKVVNNKVDSDFCVSRMLIRIPHYLHRNASTFCLENSSTNYALNAPVNRIFDTYNRYFSDVDIFHSSLPCVKNLCLSKLRQ